VSRNFSVPPRGSLSDGIVTLRSWRRDDADELVRCLDGDPAIFRYILAVPQPYTAQSARTFLDDVGRRAEDGSAHAFAVVGAGDDVLGGVGVHWNEARDVGEVGYWARAHARGRGVTTAAVLLLSRWALAQPRVGRLQLRAEPENLASCRVAERAGFHREGVLRAAQWNERIGRRVDLAMYSLLPGELS
jgi:RimJ/RimL family protein N-acetyltransferase